MTINHNRFFPILDILLYDVAMILEIVLPGDPQYPAGVGDHALTLVDAGVGTEEEPFSCGIRERRSESPFP